MLIEAYQFFGKSYQMGRMLIRRRGCCSSNIFGVEPIPDKKMDLRSLLQVLSSVDKFRSPITKCGMSGAMKMLD
jgi:hypothetical protein